MKKNTTQKAGSGSRADTSVVILHVEDNEGLNLLIQRTLHRAGFQTEGVLNGADALKKIIENPNRILLLDYILPDMTGKEFLKKLKEMKINVPFIVLTGHGNEHIAVEMMKLGARDYLIKSNGIIDKLPLIISRVVMEIENSSKLDRTLNELKESESKYHALFAKMSNGLAYHKMLTDEKNRPSDFIFLDVNKAFEGVIGISRKKIIGRKASQIIPDIASIRPVLLKTFGDVALKGIDTQFDLHFPALQKWYSVSSYCPKPGYFVASFEDITGRKELEQQLRDLSLTDDLTGLHNRRGFFTLAEQQLKIAKRKKGEMLLLSLDIDNMKFINDTLGHKEGDRALIDTARFLKKSFREADIFARIGGDEFVILQTSEPVPSTEALTARFRKNLELHNNKSRRKYRLSISIGEARYSPDTPRSIEQLLRQADKRMYREKKRSLRSR